MVSDALRHHFMLRVAHVQQRHRWSWVSAAGRVQGVRSSAGLLTKHGRDELFPVNQKTINECHTLSLMPCVLIFLTNVSGRLYQKSPENVSLSRSKHF
ncbi:hypothetical protein chiPu_0005957 [Chiloscyllium punctatum]|uniref:Uncharacterized protein n=1 Tax=Chiloscyllium punctatum TaxID=137246 RepID=A0A401SAW4_CHIPU|nr:hypothetical protein [Chiloscyllium punctatum]